MTDIQGEDMNKAMAKGKLVKRGNCVMWDGDVQPSDKQVIELLEKKDKRFDGLTPRGDK